MNYISNNIFGLTRERDLEFLYNNFLIHLQHKPITVVEVGSYLGKTAKFFSDNTHKDSVIYCLDTFSNYKVRDENSEAPDVYVTLDQFNISTNNDSKLKPIQGRSPNFPELFNNLSIDLVFLDAGHTFNQVAAELEYFWPKINNTGFITGHDYNLDYIGVVRAVNNFCDNELVLIADNSCTVTDHSDRRQIVFESSIKNWTSCWGIQKT